MAAISDALELLTAQHAELDQQVAALAETRDPHKRAALVGRLTDQLTTHLAAKQEVFYPALEAVISRDVLAEVVAEHREIRRALGDLVWLEVDDARFDGKVALLGTLLRGHTEWQESALFEACAESMSPSQLASLGAEIASWVERTETFSIVSTFVAAEQLAA